MDIVCPFSKTLICLCVSFMKGGRERNGVKLWHKQHPLSTFMVQQLATYCHLQKQTEKQSKNSQTADMLQVVSFSAMGSRFSSTSWEMPNSGTISWVPRSCLRCLLISLPRYVAQCSHRTFYSAAVTACPC